MSLDHVGTTPTPGAGSADTNGEDGEAGTGRRPRRRRLVLVAVAGLIVMVTAAAVLAVVAVGDGEGGSGTTGAGSTTTVPVEVRDLVLSVALDGELSFGEAKPVMAGRDGVVTGVAPVGTTVAQGAVLFHLDLQPTVLLHGDVPAFRDLSTGVDPGADVTQLEQALVDLGFGNGVTVDTRFTAATAVAVTAWETSLGRTDPDGVVTRGDVVFAAGDLRVAQVTAAPGTQVQSGADVVEVTPTAKVVTLDLSFDEVANLESGTPVAVKLPDASETTGTIADVATEPSTGTGSSGGGDEGEGASGEGEGEGSDETYPVTAALDDPVAASNFDSGAVEVTVETSRVEDATAVPVTALLARSQGGYALQVVDPPPDPALPPCEAATSSSQSCRDESDGYRLVPVEVGAIADGWVEVSGDGVEAGVEVVVPA